MGKAQKLKKLRREAGYSPGEEVKYNIVRTTTFKKDLSDEKEKGVPVAEMECVGPRGTYRAMKKHI